MRAQIVDSGGSWPLDGAWAFASVEAGTAASPADLVDSTLDWVPSVAPMPVAAALRDAGRWSLDESRDFDADDWWYRCRFAAPQTASPARLRFDGLATVADVWLNGVQILHSESMFVAYSVDVSALLLTDNALFIRFHALRTLLSSRRSRPKWRTGLVAHQQLRWYRTTLLGRMPSWCPPVATVGPWRPVVFESGPVHIKDSDVRADLIENDGVVRVSLALSGVRATTVTGTLTVADSAASIVCDRQSETELAVRGEVRVAGVHRWWPHTHGRQPLYSVRLRIAFDGNPVTVDLGRVGFRSLQIDGGADGEHFGIAINGVPIFCRGACWTSLDLARLNAEPAEYRVALERLRDAGMNMLRVGGTMTYEADAFHDLCDELGILVWQDFMFANMDYPIADLAFSSAVRIEARQLLERLQGRPSTAVFCGSSEVAQQAAMLGLPPEQWSNPLFDDLLPALVTSLAPTAAWVPSTPTGGTFPFQADRGVSHYYGVGAYLRPFDDARRANVQFAAECLAFSNLPDASVLDRLRDEGVTPGHHPRWKAAVPRDAGAGWDFEDVRDHYVRVLFGVDPSEVRARDMDRYLAFGRVATGEAMLRTFAEWRRPGASCRGGLVWFARDFSPGGGWGVMDSNGGPKAAYWYLKRALAPVTLIAVDEGLNGLWLHALNERPEPIEAELRVSLYRDGRLRGSRASTSVTVPARGVRSLHADRLFDGFLDLTYAYRFGPPGHDVVAATLVDRATGSVLGSAHCFPCGLPKVGDPALGLVADVDSVPGGYIVALKVERFAHAVAIEAEGFLADDNYFHLEPGDLKRVFLEAEVRGQPLRGSVSALNGTTPIPLVQVAAHAGASDAD